MTTEIEVAFVVEGKQSKTGNWVQLNDGSRGTPEGAIQRAAEILCDNHFKYVRVTMRPKASDRYPVVLIAKMTRL